MTFNRDAVASLLLFVLFAAYGIQAMQIEVFPGQELEPFKPRTMPFALAVCGMFLCGIRCVQTLRGSSAVATSWQHYDWKRAAFLCINMIIYGFLFTRLGFFAATITFLLAGFVILGERRLFMLVLLPAVFTFAFWLLATRLLGLYLAPGSWLPLAGA